MDVNCEGCAGCCIDWRPIAHEDGDNHERRGPREPLDDAYNLVPLTRSDVNDFLNAGLTDALTPRLWRADDGPSVEIDGVDLAAIDGKPAFFLGIRKPPKPVSPFGREQADWLPTCAFLDPTTLQCRIHDADAYPTECAEYPGHNLELSAQTECERVEETFGGERLLDGEPPAALSSLLLGPQAIGQKVFVHPDSNELDGVVERLLADELTPRDRATFTAAAAAGVPGTTETDFERFDGALETALDADSWVGRAIERWDELADAVAPERSLAVEVEWNAPATPGWD